MAITYEPIATTTLSTATASVSFSSIPQTYTDLVLVVRGAATASAAAKINLNNNTSGIYDDTRLFASTAAGTDHSANSGEMYVGGGWFTDGMFTVNIFNYTNTNVGKSIMSKYASPGTLLALNLTTFQSTAAVTSIQVGLNTSTYVSGSNFTLYGIKAA